MQTRLPAVKQSVINMRDGLDLATPHNSIKTGMVIDAVNYETNVQGGYRRIDGYERTAGGEPLSSNVWYSIELSSIAGLTVGQTIHSLTGTALIIGIDSATKTIGVVNMTGAFDKGNVIT
jgi:hypothetical protein